MLRPRWTISIHALLAESDLNSAYGALDGATISIHALLAESDGLNYDGRRDDLNFYPRSPCGERPVVDNIVFMPGQFLSTLSLRRATRANRLAHAPPQISIHALLAESDTAHFMPKIGTLHFYPRSPCGERRVSSVINNIIDDFYPRSPCGERPPITFRHCTTYLFLSTLSLRRATKIPYQRKIDQKNFYPRSPCGERPP